MAGRMSGIHAICAAGVALMLAGCCPKPGATRPVIVETERLVAQPIPAELLRDHPVATGPLAECPQVASARRAELEACNADKRAIQSLGKD